MNVRDVNDRQEKVTDSLYILVRRVYRNEREEQIKLNKIKCDGQRNNTILEKIYQISFSHKKENNIKNNNID